MPINVLSRRVLLVIASMGLLTLSTSASPTNVTSPRQLADAPGSLTGNVLLSGGTPAAACPVKFFAPPDYSGDGGAGKGKGKGKSGGFSFDFGLPFPILLQGKATVAAQASTDEKGNFEIKSLKPGHYRYLAGNRTTGMAGGTVQIESGKAAKIDVKLNPPTPR